MESTTHRLSVGVLVRGLTWSGGDRASPDDLRRSSMSSTGSGASLGSLSGFARSSGRMLKRTSTGHHAGAVMHRQAATRLAELTTSYKSRAELEQLEGVKLPATVIHPLDIRVQCWWAVILLAVLATLFVVPYCMAFAAYPGPYPISSPDTVIVILLSSLYALDMGVNFLVAYYDEEGCLVYDNQSIARRYLSLRFWIDLMTTIPFDWIVLAAMGLTTSDSALARYIGLLRLLTLGRAYRLRRWLAFLSNHQSISLMAVTLVRNAFMVLFTIHFAACIFYFIARQEGFSEASWVGANVEWVGGASSSDKYIYSLYWAVVTFATVGYGDIHAYSVPEALFAIIFMFINIGIGAYIIGTITLLVTKADEATGRYRDGMTALEQYSITHGIPKDLKDAMKSHLRLHHSARGASDEQILATYPATIRRRILRHLYLSPLRACWLLEGVKQKFLDAMLASARVELFMPKVDIVNEGDFVHELHILLAGACTIEGPRPGGAGPGSSEHLVLDMAERSVHGGTVFAIQPGCPFGEMAFFTETPAPQAIRTSQVCRVLSLPRQAYLGLASAFPLSAKAMLDNLYRMSQRMAEDEFVGPAIAREATKHLDAHEGLMYRVNNPEVRFVENRGDLQGEGVWGAKGKRRSSGDQGPPDSPAAPASAPDDGGWQPNGGSADKAPPSDGGMPMNRRQKDALANLVRVRGLVMAQRDNLERERVAEFLTAASKGNADKIKLMLQQGHDVSAPDYDGRDALMLAAAAGDLDIVRMLLAAGANPSRADNLGGSALLEAAKAGHDAVIDRLVSAGGKLAMTGTMAAAYLCVAVSEGDVRLLGRLLRCGANPDSSDYDRRTAAHIAAADGNLAAMRVLVETGRANLLVRDRWEATPLDEARRVGAALVVDFLAPRVGEAEAAASKARVDAHTAEQLLSACADGDAATVTHMLAAGVPPNLADYDGRTGLELAAAKGQLAIVRQLLTAGADPSLHDHLGGSPLVEAVKAGHEDIIQALVAAGGRLSLGSASALASELCMLVQSGQESVLARWLAAGADPSAADYDQRTALHIAAAQGATGALRLLVEAGAQPGLRDRWGGTPLDEATRVGAREAAAYLRGLPSSRGP